MKTNSINNQEERFTLFARSSSPFSNWYKCRFKVKKNQFSSTEQYMMYEKAMLFDDKEIAQKILKTSDPQKQKALGRAVKKFNVKTWEKRCKQIVYDGCKAKFTQNEEILRELLNTEGTTLVEASPWDTIWGIGLPEDDPKAQNRNTWQGTNWLGEVLTRLREDLLKEKK